MRPTTAPTLIIVWLDDGQRLSSASHGFLTRGVTSIVIGIDEREACP